MNIHNDAYPEPIVRLQNENKYLKEELKEEKGKLENDFTNFDIST